jgi:hypothetical protein
MAFDKKTYFHEYYLKHREKYIKKALLWSRSEKGRKTQKLYRINNKEKIKIINKKWRQNNYDYIKKYDKIYHDSVAEYTRMKRIENESKIEYQERILYNSCKVRAKKKGLQFDIKRSDIKIPDVCPILGTKFEKNNKHSMGDNSVSVDRIVPEKGYTKGNVQIICGLANRMKNSATPEQLVKFSKWIESNIRIGEK